MNRYFRLKGLIEEERAGSRRDVTSIGYREETALLELQRGDYFTLLALLVTSIPSTGQPSRPPLFPGPLPPLAQK
jgi:hypothetical protein